ncbi:LysR family transcriptional regulator [Pseudothauera nasutitermitis]|uniref:LysR family transcriptional regulator n=1 Tax=Pseudothauera nasutitermitis TaxID=2565930 RepID=A0A4S4B110_9RHOO|nr:LysR family transcriptional regulator [Pseudothauera nasutitermitis]THF66193.1 LysR family transcriptional regulator [Pseudothauera nasutitermitis]
MDRIRAAQVFVAIAERGSLTKAAELLDMSRAMVTRHLAEMESWAGARLFHRSTRRIGLTAAGEATLARCREMLALAEQVPSAGEHGGSTLRGILRIACAPSLAQATLATAVARFLQRHPETAVVLQVDYQAVNLVGERIDLAIRITNHLEPGLIARRIGDCPSVVCASPDYLRRHGTPRRAEDLAEHNCLTYAYFGRSLWHFRRAGGTVGVPVGGNLSANDSLVLLHAALAGAGIVMQPAYSAAPWIASGELVALLPGETPQLLGIHALYASREYQPALLRAMLDHLAKWFGDDSRLAADAPGRTGLPHAPG